MPDIKAPEAHIIKLYQRCKDMNALPFSGGILEQPEWIMECFDTIETARREFEKTQEDNLKRDQVRARLKEGLIHG